MLQAPWSCRSSRISWAMKPALGDALGCTALCRKQQGRAGGQKHVCVKGAPLEKARRLGSRATSPSVLVALGLMQSNPGTQPDVLGWLAQQARKSFLLSPLLRIAVWHRCMQVLVMQCACVDVPGCGCTSYAVVLQPA